MTPGIFYYLLLLFSFHHSSDPANEIHIKKVDDFSFSAEKTSGIWNNIQWTDLPQRSKESGIYNTHVKIAYSNTGMYFLFDCPDKKLTATITKDGERLWNEDVAELFLWPDQKSVEYFEYEISPLNHELVLLVARDSNNVARWTPFFFPEEMQTTRHMVKISGGEQKPNASITGWTAEIFIPYKLLSPLKNINPIAGTKWRANFYRVDYDNKQSDWTWQPVKKSYHEYNQFGYLIFD